MDAAPSDKITEENLEQAAAFARQFARQAETIAVITGAIDIVTDGIRTFCIRNGHPMMNRVTGTGCQLSALTCAFLAANPGQPLAAAAAAAAAMGFAGRLPTKDWDLWTEAVPIEPISWTPSIILRQTSWRKAETMKLDRKQLLLYAVTDRAWTGRQSLYEQVELALRGGATCVQLREKNWLRKRFWLRQRKCFSCAGITAFL